MCVRVWLGVRGEGACDSAAVDLRSFAGGQQVGVQDAASDRRPDSAVRPEDQRGGRLYAGRGVRIVAVHVYAQGGCALGNGGAATKWVFYN